MYEVYLSGIPMQRMDKKNLYKPKNYENEYNVRTCFPIIPIMNMNRGSLEDKKIITIRAKNSDTDYNMPIFRNEVHQAVGENGARAEIIDISAPRISLRS